MPGILLAAFAAAGCVPEGAEGPEGIEVNTQALQSGGQPFTTFESGQVRPLAMTPDRKHLLATNTPDGKLEIYQIKKHGLKHVASVPVGLEPVAVAARNNHEAWVVNHLSDSVSIVRLDGKKSRVVRTLLVADEPRDIVFAGPNKSRAFITTAHRGQNAPYDPQLTTPGIGRADVWVFDAENCGDSSLGGTPLTIITLFSDTPRALAVTPDGSRVYAAAFNSGNRTSVTFAANIVALTESTPLFPLVNAFGEVAPFPAVIVKWTGEHWIDETGQIRDGEVMFTLPDKDVFVIDANANPPRQLEGDAGFYSSVGTILFNMIVNPKNGKVYVSNLESNNQQRFEGENNFAGPITFPAPSVRGRIAFSRITVLDPNGGVSPRHLNKHIDYDTCCAPIPNQENEDSIAFPLEMAITKDGKTLYVASLGTSEIAVYDTAELENDTFVPSAANQIPVSGGGPTGLVLDEKENRLYVLTRFDNSITIIDTKTRTEIGKVPMYNPEPEHVVVGRRFLYDASFSSSHGDSACASCHIFGDMDHLAWDLGNPDQPTVPDPNPYDNPSDRKFFHSMKGPMTTQSLRGMANHGPMHWRGDRTGADINHPELNVQPDGGAFNERAAFMAFNPAFQDLLGRHEPIPQEDMEAFTSFILEVMYPPNPIRNLDNSLTPEQQLGADIFFGPKTFFDPLGPELNCNFCHTFDRNANAGLVDKPGFFGSNGRSADVAGLQNVKNPHLRNQYQKIGMFGFQFTPILTPSPDQGVFMGEQIRGFGFSHDGSFDTNFRFLFVPNFADVNTVENPFLGVPIENPEGISVDEEGIAKRRALEAFMLAADSNHAPIVGQQITLTERNQVIEERIDLLIERAEAGECDLIVRGDAKEGYLYAGNGWFLQNRHNKPPISDSKLRKEASKKGGLTYTCVPVGNGERLGLDRDLDGVLDGNEHP